MPKIQHMVLIKMNPDVPQATVDDLLAQVAELQTLVPGMTYFAGGPYASPEGFNQGYTHGFLMTFESVEARDNYLPHPEHERVKAALFPNVEAAVAFDIEAD